MTSKTIVHSAKAAQAIGPYSQAVFVNNTLYISGQLGIDVNTGQLVDTVQQQTHQALCNMGHILQQAGMTFNHVVKTTVLLANMSDFNTVNQVYSKYFQSNFPARAAYQVAALPKGGLVEIEAVAVSDLGTVPQQNTEDRPVLKQQDSLYQHTV